MVQINRTQSKVLFFAAAVIAALLVIVPYKVVRGIDEVSIKTEQTVYGAVWSQPPLPNPPPNFENSDVLSVNIDYGRAAFEWAGVTLIALLICLACASSETTQEEFADALNSEHQGAIA
jgi:hypothetical protein